MIRTGIPHFQVLMLFAKNTEGRITYCALVRVRSHNQQKIMHLHKIHKNSQLTILISVYKRQIYQIAQSIRIEKIDSVAKIESKLFCPNWNALVDRRLVLA